MSKGSFGFKPRKVDKAIVQSITVIHSHGTDYNSYILHAYDEDRHRIGDLELFQTFYLREFLDTLRDEEVVSISLSKPDTILVVTRYKP